LLGRPFGGEQLNNPPKKTAYPTDKRGYKHVLVAGVNHLSSAITKKNHEDGTFPA
jgi:hypothetical protein